MTADEAAKLKPGDRVEARVPDPDGGWRWHPAVVLDKDLRGWSWDTGVRVKYFAPGCRAVTVWRKPAGIRPSADRPAANVFADYLEERGYSEAAAELRRAFPVASWGGAP